MSNPQDQWPHCADHPDSPYQFLLLSQQCNLSRISCAECLYLKDNAQEQYGQKIPLAIALKSPEIIIGQMKKDSGKQLRELFKICEIDLEKQFNDQIVKFEFLSNIFIQMKDQITQKLKKYKEIQEKIKKQKEQYFEKCNCNLLKQLIDQLKELDKQFKSDQYMQIITKINRTVDEMLQDNFALINKNTNEIIQSQRQMRINLYKPNHEQIITQITQLFQRYSNFIGELNDNIYSRQFQFPQFKVLTIEYFYQIIDKVEQGSKKQIESINLIYLGSRDGLNGDAYWSRVYGKRNLLIILKSKINQVFGGYSPCQWEGNCVYKQDDTLTSFLFQQTKNQIYPLNQNYKQNAICCNRNCGPYFGSGQDLLINGDFNSGYSNLGTGYILDQQYKSQKNTHLFGESSPKIIECEIYELKLS